MPSLNQVMHQERWSDDLQCSQKYAFLHRFRLSVLTPQSLDWIFGFSKDIVGGLHNLTDSSRDVRVLAPLVVSPAFLTLTGFQAVFYSSGHTGVVYDYAVKRQYLLQGHVRRVVGWSCIVRLSDSFPSFAVQRNNCKCCQ